MLGAFVGTVLGVMLGVIVGITLSERSWNWKTHEDGYKDIAVALAVVAALIIVGFRIPVVWELISNEGTGQ